MVSDLILSPSPNFNERPLGPDGDRPTIDTIILHYTGMKTADAALERMCDPTFEVSAHYMIDMGGSTHQLVAPEKRAWHAGVSCWQGRHNLNNTSIGIELVNPGHEFGYCDFPDGQLTSLLRLLGVLCADYNVPSARVLGHSDIAPDRKMDPGEKFPWQLLATNGFGIWPETSYSDKSGNEGTILAKKGMIGTESAWLNKTLCEIGYSVEQGDLFSLSSHYGILAFQRHWCPASISGHLDTITKWTLVEISRIMQIKTKN
jgi:N-acetylmuramoyl-L-alanine amidase